jgi:hypothetical protein
MLEKFVERMEVQFMTDTEKLDVKNFKQNRNRDQQATTESNFPTRGNFPRNHQHKE